jgi:NO-binding membrane sensor protein with MHYT domain
LDFLLNLTFIGLRALSLIPGIYLNDIILSVISHSFVTWLCSCVSLLAVFRLVSLTGRIILRDAILGVVIFAIAVLIYIYI